MTSYRNTTHSTSFDPTHIPTRSELLFGQDCPAGIRHDIGWLCVHHILSLAEKLEHEAKPGSWYVLGAKKQWMECRMTDQALQRAISMAQPQMQPTDREVRPTWNDTERQSLHTALTDIQGELTLEERAWIEADTAECLAQDAITRMVWSTIQLIPPVLSQIMQATHYTARYLHMAYVWKTHRHVSWEHSQQKVASLLQIADRDLQRWLQQQWHTVVQQHQQAQAKLIGLFRQRYSRLLEQDTLWQEHWETLLFS